MAYNISGVILAGGAGKRYNGFTKANLVIDGKTIISGITDTIKDIFSDIIIVTNKPEEFVQYKSHIIVSDLFLNAGPLGGIHAALKTSSREALFIFGGDMPHLNKDLIIKQLEFYNLHKCDILVPRVGQYIEPLHAIYSSSVLKTLEEYFALKRSFAVYEFIKMVNVNYMQLDNSVETRKAFTNINSSEDISLLQK